MSSRIPLLAALAFLAGCVDRPLMIQRLTGPGEQAQAIQPEKGANSTRDWELSARAVADDMARHLLLPNPYGPSPDTAYYVHSQAPGSAFLHEVAAALQTEITNRGGIMARAPAGALVVNLDVNVVQSAAPTWFDSSAVVTEVVWTASVMERDRMLFTHREPLYVSPADAGLYASDMTAAAITSPGAAPAADVRRLRFQ